MHQARNIIDDIYYVGASDRRLHLLKMYILFQMAFPTTLIL